MKQPKADSANTKPVSKEKKQLAVLGALGAVLVVVLGAQFSESDEGGGAAPEQPALAMDGSGATSVAGGASSGGITPVPDNEALSSDASQGIVRNPFESFWHIAAPIETTSDEIAAPSITLNGTMTSGRHPIAVIDGQTKQIGDSVQGWRLVRIGSREITLESPTKNVVTVKMPLLQVP